MIGIDDYDAFSTCRLGGHGLLSRLRAGVRSVAAPEQENDFVTSQYALVYVALGEGEFCDETGAVWPLRPGSVFQRFPDRRHSVSLRGPVLRCYVAVPRQALELLRLTGVVDDQQPVFELESCKEIVDRFSELTAELAGAQPEQLMEVLLQMLGFITDLHRLSGRRGSRTNEAMAQACEMLAADDGRSIRQVAEALSMSSSSFRQQFTAQIGFPPGDYRIRCRIERAIEMLCNSDKTITEIAEALGYCDVYAFSSQFKRFTQISPTRFRNERM